MSLIDVIGYFASGDAVGGSYVVSRQAVSTYVNGRLVATGSPTTQTITACIQPLNGRELQLLVEAGVTSESLKVYTDFILIPRAPGQEPDQITIRGEQWVVYNVSRWEAFGEVFVKAIVARKELT